MTNNTDNLIDSCTSCVTGWVCPTRGAITGAMAGCVYKHHLTCTHPGQSRPCENILCRCVPPPSPTQQHQTHVSEPAYAEVCLIRVRTHIEALELQADFE